MSCSSIGCSCSSYQNIDPATGYPRPQKRQTSILQVGTAEPLPPWPTLEEIRKVIRDELRKAGVV